MADRVFGWVQDASRYDNLRTTVECFEMGTPAWERLVAERIPQLVTDGEMGNTLLQALYSTPMRLSYGLLTGRDRPGEYSGILPLVLDGQSNGPMRGWSVDSFVRWAHALQLIKYHVETDAFSITDRGHRFVNTQSGSEEEYEILEEALLSYPPAVRVLSLLAGDPDRALSKHEIGHQLGFVGEPGFTSFTEATYVREWALADAERRKELKNILEGDSTKYARQICSWLCHLKHPWARGTRKSVLFGTGDGRQVPVLMGAWQITADGYAALHSATGTSCHPRSPKFVPNQMLATKSQDRDYLRTRRYWVLSTVATHASTLRELVTKLSEKDITTTESAVASDLQGLYSCGLAMHERVGRWKCDDTIIGLEAPLLEAPPVETNIRALVERIKGELQVVPAEYAELVAMSYDGSSNASSLKFEVKTMELLRDICHLSAVHLGGPNRPDGLAIVDGSVVIIDTKAYSQGFSIPVGDRDKMIRYIEDLRSQDSRRNPQCQWWEWVGQQNVAVNGQCFLFVSSQFVGAFRAQLQIISAPPQDTRGAAVTAETLLRLVDQVQLGLRTNSQLQADFCCLDEILVSASPTRPRQT